MSEPSSSGAILQAVGAWTWFVVWAAVLLTASLEPSLRIGTHAFVGRVLAMVVKHAVSLVMVLLILRATFPA